ncbi:HesB/YadR/YfhF family protein [Bacillus sp. DX4.1]|uniref:HesB/YadR/YfhF family protein n=1 Tax=Bacillus sp. DX4.1 TaxID=3055867 RepID=UPI0025A3014C|nr:HesB/YadR/YfhF family protein [Bacillus sp. DX4.1]MDM5189257.1 HesB/YadR/YfhF family protein [Bacillus sp. DX4.1]
MNISISKEAVNWYKDELKLQSGDALRFFVQYGGCSTVQKGLSLGIRKDDPAHPAAQIQEEGISFFVEGDDEWFFDGHNLSVIFNDGDDFPQFHYEK